MNSAYNMLGLCMRAGRLVSGQTAVEESLKKGKARLVVMDALISEGSEKAITDACRFRNTPAIKLLEPSLGDAIGKPGRIVAAVTDQAFADRIRQLLA